MADLKNFPQEAKLSILEKVKGKTQFYLEQGGRKKEEVQAENLLQNLNNL
ncbi:MAG: hypothetical protein WC285_02050 [Candidatus Gracilibacteria bacterium]|jgi:hypothetical protein